MKIITIKVFTSLSEVRTWWKEFKSKKYKHNRKLLFDLEKEICDEINNKYWSKDISDYARKQLTNGCYSKIRVIFRNYRKELK